MLAIPYVQELELPQNPPGYGQVWASLVPRSPFVGKPGNWPERLSRKRLGLGSRPDVGYASITFYYRQRWPG
jgi:hypothetical protein